MIYLLEKTGGGAATPSGDMRRFDRHWTPVHLDFVVDDLDAGLRSAISAGALLEVPATQHDWGRIAEPGDPFAHGFCLIEFSSRGYDAIATPLSRATGSEHGWDI